jgi:hypothetical protein
VIDIYNNTIDGTAKAVGAISFNHGFAAGNQTKSVYVHDNTIILRGSGAKVGALDESGGAYAGMWAPGNIRYDFNHYFVLDTAAVHFEWQGNKSWTQWRAVPQDANGTISPI